MDLKDVIRQDLIIMNLREGTKTEIVESLVRPIVKAGIINPKDQAKFTKRVMSREKLSSTGIGHGIAIPHGMSEFVLEPVIVYGKSDTGLEFDSVDGQKVHHFFLIASPIEEDHKHLEILASLSTRLMKKEVIKSLNQAQSPDDIMAIFSSDSTKASEDFDILVIVNDPYNYDTLSSKFLSSAKTKGYKLKITSADNLDLESLKKIDKVILVGDISIDLSYFKEKHLIQTTTSKAIQSADLLLNQAFETVSPKTSPFTQAVKHSFPLILGGAVLIALSFLMDVILKVPHGSLENLGSYHKLSAFFNTLGVSIYNLFNPVFSAFIAYSMAGPFGFITGLVSGALVSHANSGFLAAVIAGYLSGYIIKKVKEKSQVVTSLSQDLWIPIFGILVMGLMMSVINPPIKMMIDKLYALTAHSFFMMPFVILLNLGKVPSDILLAQSITQNAAWNAAYLASTMVFVLGIFLSVFVFSRKSSKEEKTISFSNVILCLPEGILYFLSRNPKSTLLSLILGSSLSAILIDVFSISSLIPFGGLLSVMWVGKPVLYIFVILIGSMVAVLMMYGFEKLKP